MVLPLSNITGDSLVRSTTSFEGGVGLVGEVRSIVRSTTAVCDPEKKTSTG